MMPDSEMLDARASQNMTPSTSSKGRLSLQRFFNCCDLSDRTLEVIEDDDVNCKEPRVAYRNFHSHSIHSLIKAEDCRDAVSQPCGEGHARRQPGQSLSRRQTPDTTVNSGDEDNTVGTSSPKRRKYEDADGCQSSGVTRRIIYIHSLLFCSNSQYFQKLLMTDRPSQCVQVRLSHGESDGFIKLVKLFYDDSQIETLSLLDTASVLSLAERFSCTNIVAKLVDHLSRCKIDGVATLNRIVLLYQNSVSSGPIEGDELTTTVKKLCRKFLKQHFCPLEKVFGPLLVDFLALSLDSLKFLLETIDTGIAVTENTVIAMAIFWLDSQPVTSLRCEDFTSNIVGSILERCRFEHVSDVSFLMDVVSPAHRTLSLYRGFKDFYTCALEYLACAEKQSYFPSYARRANRGRYFAYDHEAILYFAPFRGAPEKNGVDKASLNLGEPVHLFQTVEPNAFFSRGYQLALKAATFLDQGRKELRLKITVTNVARYPHSRIFVSMLYAIASPSVSENFSPWTFGSATIEPNDDFTWSMISLIADQSQINDTGFYLRIYFE